jgi:hypothetical protein
MAEPVARCQCGYQLLEGQDCPECGRTYHEAWLLQNEYEARTKAVCWLLSLVSFSLSILPVLALAVSRSRWPQSTGLSLAGNMSLPCSWTFAGILAVAAFVLATVLKRNRGDSRFLLGPLILQVSVLVFIAIVLAVLLVV